MDFLELDNKRKEHLLGGGQERQQEQRKKGKMTAFERINTLFDPGNFQEIDAFVTHDCHDFGMENKKILDDVVVNDYCKNNLAEFSSIKIQNKYNILLHLF